MRAILKPIMSLIGIHLACLNFPPRIINNDITLLSHNRDTWYRRCAGGGLANDRLECSGCTGASGRAQLHEVPVLGTDQPLRSVS